MLKEPEGGFFCQYTDIKQTGLQNHVMGQIALEDRNRDTGGIIGHLYAGIDDTGVVLLSFTGGQEIDTIG